MMDADEVKSRISHLRAVLESNPNTPWWQHTMADCIESLVTTVDLLGKSLEEQKRLQERCDSLEKRYSELLYRLKSGD